MKLKLNVLERITVLNLLPKQENYLTFRMVTELKKELSFTEVEIKKFGVVFTPDGRVSWKDGKTIKNIDVPDTISAMLVEKLKSLEKDKKIDEENVSLYEKLVLNKN